jgi:hypothetical protein
MLFGSGPSTAGHSVFIRTRYPYLEVAVVVVVVVDKRWRWWYIVHPPDVFNYSSYRYLMFVLLCQCWLYLSIHQVSLR